jgi:tetratricopeptide (TPR) repeat protein
MVCKLQFLYFIAAFVCLLEGCGSNRQDQDDCKNGTPERSIVACTRILNRAIAGKQEPLVDYSEVYRNRGNSYRHTNQTDLALKDFSTAILLNPQSALAYDERGRTYTENGLKSYTYPLAIKDFSEVIRLDPNDANAYVTRGWAYLEFDKAEMALPDAMHAVELDPKDANTYDLRARVYDALNQKNLAIADFRKSLAIDANRPENTKRLLELLGITP